MAYFSKETILGAYKTLSTLSEDPSTQGATQRISAIRYFLALDMFYRVYNRPCDTQKRNDATEYIEYVGKVVAVNDNAYTTNFYDTLKTNSDYAVGSNFYSVNVVHESIANGGEKLAFPRRGSNPLMYVRSGKLYEDKSLINNIKAYISADEHKCALTLWLLRDTSIVQNSLYLEIQNALSALLTDSVCKLILPSKEAFSAYCQKQHVTLAATTYKPTTDDIKSIFKESSNDIEPFKIPHQAIFFGSPGTGKSYKIKHTVLADVSDDYIFRTTFHPDTDYASFVGCYKPVTNKAQQPSKAYTIEELADFYKREVGPTEILKTGHIEPRIMFGIKYCEYFGGSAANYDTNRMLELAGKELATGCSEDRVGITYVQYGINIGLKMGNQKSAAITYDFAPQTFTNAYVKAWKDTTKPVYLVIEEINRGNCAQIFGDLFQLLDRDDNGVSEYPIKADADLTKYLQEELGTDHEGIADEKIKLPANLYILATMNTSDQSLFPMDSAFKRRWEWKYVPTSVIGDKKKILKVENKEETVLLGREQEKKVLRLGMYEYDWSVFLEKINKCIRDATHSDDKQLGFWFVKTPKDSNLIDVETFVSKVIFYLWTDVFKDFGAKATNPFAFKTAEGEMVVCPFSSFFDPYTGDINAGQIHGFMYNLGIIPEFEQGVQEAIDKRNEDEDYIEA